MTRGAHAGRAHPGGDLGSGPLSALGIRGPRAYNRLVLLGRAAESAQVDCLLTAAQAGTSGTLLILGDPGIGKTALLRDAAEHAGQMTVLTARGIEAEADVPFSGLLELLRPIMHCLERIPTPQALALRSGLAL